MRSVRYSPCVVTGVILMFAVAILPGCRGSDAPPLGEVEGTVTLDGQPLADARISFYPQEGGRSSEAVTDASGHYVLRYTDAAGAKVGVHKVSISTFEESRQEDDGSKIPGVPEKVPAKYNTESTLTQEVKSGKQTINFDLQSK